MSTANDATTAGGDPGDTGSSSAGAAATDDRKAPAPGETPVADASVDAAPADAVPADAVPADAVPADAVPADAVPADAVPADAVPADAVPADAVPADAVPADTVPADTADAATGPNEPHTDDPHAGPDAAATVDADSAAADADTAAAGAATNDDGADDDADTPAADAAHKNETPDADATDVDAADADEADAADAVGPDKADAADADADATGPDKADDADAVVPPRRRRWLRVLTIITVVLVVLAGAVVGAAALLVRRYDNSVQQESLLGAAAVPAPTTKQEDGRARIEGPLNILLVGIDEQDDEPGAGARSDSIIILHVNADHSRAYLLSIPRDTRVQLPAYPKSNYRGGTDKINAAFSIGWRNGGGRGGGFELLSLAVQQLTGMRFNAGGIVNFAGLTAVVDALGGVDMCVDEEVTSIHVGWDASGNLKAPYILMAPDFARAEKVPGVRAQVYHVGCQHFNGWQALDYVRQRELISDGDYGRQRHQQQLLSALAGKLTASGMLSDPLGTDRALRALGNSVTFDGNKVSLLDWIFTLKGLRPANLTMLKTNGGQFTTEMIGGRSFEATSPTTLEMYTAARNDTLDAFVAAHPDWVSK